MFIHLKWGLLAASDVPSILLNREHTARKHEAFTQQLQIFASASEYILSNVLSLPLDHAMMRAIA
jgi:hypothetical protein